MAPPNRAAGEAGSRGRSRPLRRSRSRSRLGAVSPLAEQAFTRLFGPDKNTAHLGEFLGYFMIRKVIVPATLTAAARRVTKDLVEWLAE